MMKFSIWILLFVGVLFSSLYAGDPNSVQAKEAAVKPSVLLTFDDAFIEQWLAVMPIFERYNAKATFFITGFDKLSKEQIASLKKIKAAGHTIGCHSLRHKKAVDYAKEFSLEQYWNDDVEPAIKLMTDSGFEPSCFAYPSSQNNADTDKLLLKYFSHLRSGVRYSDAEKIFVPAKEIRNKGCLYGTSIDSSNQNLKIEDIFALMDKAMAEDKCIVFYGHNIADGTTRLYTTPERLEQILKYGKSIGLEFIGYDQIKRNKTNISAPLQ